MLDNYEINTDILIIFNIYFFSTATTVTQIHLIVMLYIQCPSCSASINLPSSFSRHTSVKLNKFELESFMFSKVWKFTTQK